MGSLSWARVAFYFSGLIFTNLFSHNRKPPLNFQNMFALLRRTFDFLWHTLHVWNTDIVPARAGTLARVVVCGGFGLLSSVHISHTHYACGQSVKGVWIKPSAFPTRCYLGFSALVHCALAAARGGSIVDSAANTGSAAYWSNNPLWIRVANALFLPLCDVLFHVIHLKAEY